MTTIDIEKIDFAKGNGLVPTVIQDKTTHKVLMLGYMNKESSPSNFGYRKGHFL